MKSFELINFRSFESTGKIELKPITIFVGKNSCGKSSLLRFPVILAQTFKQEVYTPILFNGALIDFGSFDDVVHNHVGNSIKFKLSFDKDDIRAVRIGLNSNNNIETKKIMEYQKTIEEISIDVSIEKYSNKILVTEFELTIGTQNVMSIKRTPGNNYLLILKVLLEDNSLIEIDKYIEIAEEVSFDKFIPVIDTLSKNFNKKLVTAISNTFYKGKKVKTGIVESIIDIYQFHSLFNEDDLEKMFSNVSLLDRQLLEKMQAFKTTFLFITSILKGISIKLNSDANRIAYIGPFRKTPDRIYRDSESYYNNVGVAGENTTMLLRQAQQGKSNLLDKVSRWFFNSMGYKINIEEIKGSSLFNVTVENEQQLKGDNIIDVGYGISQVLPIVTQLYYEGAINAEQRRYFRADRNNYFIIEQPELHLHPAAQAQLADLFVEKVISQRNCKMLIETHSEHLIRKLQVLVADRSVGIKSDDVAIYYIDKNENNVAYIDNIKIMPNGQFDKKWPSGFFDKSYQLSKELISVAYRGE